jgi:hypothetical protein
MAALTQSRVLCAFVIHSIILMFSSFFEDGLYRVFACRDFDSLLLLLHCYTVFFFPCYCHRTSFVVVVSLGRLLC